METESSRAIIEEAQVIISKMEDLLSRSESRIEQTNRIVKELSCCINGINSAYIHHIDQAVDNNRHLIEQNQELIKQIASSQETIRKEAERNDRLMDSLVQMLRPTPSVSINQ